MEILQGIFVQHTEDKGNGVFTNIPLAAGTTIEVSPVIVMTADERKLLDQTLLHDYIFEWKPDGKNLCCMAQGYISVYNHSTASNCEYFMDYSAETMMVKTISDVAAGEELTVNYNGDWDNEKPVWFDTK
ncbi:MAG: SET domain-containing protein-lysine N-methyltransferase [Chitinophagales bacterium]|nr:SET domain-containing protein-lysine N-methyltransferase [Chitinophagales bacterium]